MSKRNHGAIVALLGFIVVLPTRSEAQTITPPSGVQGITTGGTSEILIKVDPAVEARESKALELRTQGRALYAAGKLSDAAKKFEESLSLSTVTAGLFPELADIYQRTGRTQDAMNLYRFQVNYWKSKDTKTLLTYALLLLKTNQPQEAVTVYHEALIGMPRNEYLVIPLQLRFDIAPASVPTSYLEAAIETGLGMLDYYRGYREKALPHLRRATVLYPNFATAQYYFGAALRQSPDKRDQAMAKKALQKAVEMGTPAIQEAAKKLSTEP